MGSEKGRGGRLTNSIPTYDLIRFLEGEAGIIILRTDWLRGSITSDSSILHWWTEVHTITLTFHFRPHTFNAIVSLTV